MWLSRPVWILPGRKSIRQVFLWCGCLMTKPTKWHVRPANRGFLLPWKPEYPPSLISVFAVRMKKALSTHWTHSEDWSDWVDALADLSLRWAHTHFVLVLSRGRLYHASCMDHGNCVRQHSYCINLNLADGWVREGERVCAKVLVAYSAGISCCQFWLW